jgi:hypothetical protein
MTNSRRDERLISRQVDGLATPEEWALLKERLREDPQVRRAFELEQRLVEGLAQLPVESTPYDIVAAAARRAAVEERSVKPSWIRWSVVGAVAVLAAMVGVGWWMGPGHGPAAGDARLRTAVAAPLVASAVTGTVWIEDGAGRRRTHVGDAVTAGARLESEGDGSVTLARASSVSVTVFEETSVELASMNGGGVSWHMDRGVLSAESFDGAAPLSIEIRGLGEAVRVRQGHGGVLADGTGGFAVACTRGQVEVTGAGGTVPVSAGQELVGRGSRRRVRRTTGELALEVTPTGPVPAGTRDVVVSGTTTPGVLLTVAGQQVTVGDDGRFSVSVPYDGRSKRLVVRVRDVLDRSREGVLALAPAPRRDGPGFRRIETRWEWERPRGR